ncbi:unnamed protein product [Mesocestoides corti]|uniref:Uncharacterized protein n=1 Tax=Mesocestoides corti TaxID=53468 RepID=A0A0R3UMR4_MESCO|nr:unnamed protein product [Mesocestoides corti]
MLHAWDRLHDSPQGIVNHQAVLLDNRVYIIGGYFREQRTAYEEIAQIDLFVYDLDNGSQRNHYFSPKSSSEKPRRRYGHSVVAWRGRGWLYGGRTDGFGCFESVYMFTPCKTPSPTWARVVGINGAPPVRRDGHSAAVLNDCMFIFGGYLDELQRLDNTVYRLNFLTWSWSTIDIVGTQPLPRDFASLTVTPCGRLFMFGGRCRSITPDEDDEDVYDAILWELVPNDATALKPCPYEEICRLRSRGPKNFGIMVEETLLGQWREDLCDDPNEVWHSTPTRPLCLQRHIAPPYQDSACSGFLDPTAWNSCTWRVVHRPVVDCSTPLPLTPHLMMELREASLITANEESMLLMDAFTSGLSSDDEACPLGRRSQSTWYHAGNIFVAFGSLKCPRLHAKFYFNDIRRFSLSEGRWYRVNCATPLPPARRRTVAVPLGVDGRVFVFGGTHPELAPPPEGHLAEAVQDGKVTLPPVLRISASGDTPTTPSNTDAEPHSIPSSSAEARADASTPVSNSSSFFFTNRPLCVIASYLLGVNHEVPSYDFSFHIFLPWSRPQFGPEDLRNPVILYASTDEIASGALVEDFALSAGGRARARSFAQLLFSTLAGSLGRDAYPNEHPTAIVWAQSQGTNTFTIFGTSAVNALVEGFKRQMIAVAGRFAARLLDHISTSGLLLEPEHQRRIHVDLQMRNQTNFSAYVSHMAYPTRALYWLRHTEVPRLQSLVPLFYRRSSFLPPIFDHEGFDEPESDSSICSEDDYIDTFGVNGKEVCASIPSMNCCVLRGSERLRDLADCYILYPDATLYQLCLLRVRRLCRNLLQLPPDIPWPILGHLRHLFPGNT